jgi:peptidoglycan/xylan/chitin deacetylase (PgdA/CDA1 family)
MSAFVALIYHNLDTEPRHEYAVKPTVFREQLAYLQDRGFVMEGFRELARRLESAEPFPPQYGVISFDDGHRSNLEAAEIVREAGYQATFFLTRNVMNAEGFLRESAVTRLAELCSLGSHGLSHHSLLKMPESEARRELGDSRKWLEDLTSAPVLSFSPPGGDLGRRNQRLALELGYTLIGDSFEWWNHPANLATTRLVHRVMVYGSYSLREFARIVELKRSFFIRRGIRSALLGVSKRILTESGLSRAARLKRLLRRN